MCDDNEPFSRREGFAPEPAPITVRQDAPADLRHALIALGRLYGLTYGQLVSTLTEVLLVVPEGNWNESYFQQEAERLIRDAPWPKVYDCAEALYRRLRRRHEIAQTDPPAHQRFEAELNNFFVERGIGWQMRAGRIEFRGPQALEEEIVRTTEELIESGRDTAATELTEARRDLSRRPDPDTTGAIQHAMASLECVARKLTGSPSATFGAIINQNPDLFPPPLNHAMHKLWGFASQVARHLQEGQRPTVADAVLVVGLAASAMSYLLERERAGDQA